MTLAAKESFSDSKSAKLLKLSLIAFILVQPFFDCYYFYTEKLSAVIGFTIPPLASVLWIGAMVLFFFLCDLKGNLRKKSSALLLIYLVLAAVYFVIHHLTNTDFVSVSPDNYGYSMVHEAYYVVRMLMPFLVLFLTYELCISKEEFYRCIEFICVVVTGVIVVSNLLCVSLSSYTNKTISANIFAWFTDAVDSYDAKELTSKGFFCYANQTAALLMFLYPIVLYRMVSRFNVWRVGLVLMHAIAMIMLGTQTSSYGVALELVVFIAVVLFSAVLTKKINKAGIKKYLAPVASLLVITVLVITVLPNSPVVGKAIATEKLHEERAKTEKKLTEKDIDAYYKLSFEDRVEYMNDNFEKYSLQWSYCKEAYPLDYDPDFWYEMMKQPIDTRFDFRYLESHIITAVVEKNDDPADKLFGISATRETNICKLEHDYLAQYYSLGAVGVAIFMAPYVIFALWYSLRSLFKRNWENIFENLSLAMALDILLLVGYVTGNCLDVLFTTVVMGLFLGRMLLNIKESKGGKEVEQH